MTKRFKLFTGNNYGVQSVDGEVFIDSIVSIGDADVLVDLLNELSDENKQLKMEIGKQQEEIEILSEEKEQLKKDVDYWKQVASQYSNELNVFEHCKKYKTECNDIHWSSD